MPLLSGSAGLLVLNALNYAVLVLLELALIVRAGVLMMKHVPLENDGVLSVRVRTVVLSAHAASGAATHRSVGLFPGLEEVQKVTDLMRDILASLEVVDVL